jgi:hypothetical protein
MSLPVLVLDVNEEEADKLLATLDPLAAMALRDDAKLKALLSNVFSGDTSKEVGALLSSISKQSKAPMPIFRLDPTSRQMAIMAGDDPDVGGKVQALF